MAHERIDRDVIRPFHGNVSISENGLGVKTQEPGSKAAAFATLGRIDVSGFLGRTTNGGGGGWIPGSGLPPPAYGLSQRGVEDTTCA